MKPATSGAHAVDNEKGEVKPVPDMRANRYDVVSRLADDLAHEIKNSLNAIVVNLEVLRRKIATGAAETALERANVVDQEILRVHRLVDELLQLVRPPRVETSPLSLDEALGELRPLLEVQAKAARAAFQLSADSGLFARIGRDTLKFAVLNVVTAVYAADGAAESIVIETRANGANAEIVVRNSSAPVSDGNEYVQHARALMGGAGGELEVQGNLTMLRVPSCSSFG